MQEKEKSLGQKVTVLPICLILASWIFYSGSLMRARVEVRLIAVKTISPLLTFTQVINSVILFLSVNLALS